MALKTCVSLGLLALTAQAHAQSVANAPAATYSLTPEQKAAVLDGNTEYSAEAAQAGFGRSGSGLGGGGPERQIHGEVGAAVGTGGARGIYGTAAVPLGENAGAIFSFEQSRFGDHRR